MRGTFLSLEGGDGTGKSTQVLRLVEWLRSTGRDVVYCREPGGTPAGERLRDILLDPVSDVTMTCEMLMYMASRAQLTAAVIEPALSAGKTVVCDRHLLSTIVYQGYAGGLDVEAIRTVGDVATSGVMPDWVGVLDVAEEVAAVRRGARADRSEARPVEFHRRVRAGFLAEAKRDPGRIHVIDAAQSQDEVFACIRGEVERVLAAASRS